MKSDCADCHQLAEVRVDPTTGAVIRTQSEFGLPGASLPADYNQHRILTDMVWTLATARDSGSVTLMLAKQMKSRKSAISTRSSDQSAK
jgi:hypothetical protein